MNLGFQPSDLRRPTRTVAGRTPSPGASRFLPRFLPRFLALVAALGLTLGLTIATARADRIEFLSGSKLEGKVSKIDKENRQVTIDAEISGRTLTRTFPYDKIHAVTLGEKRYVLNEKGSTPGAPPAAKSGTTADSSTGSTAPKTKPSGAGASAKTVRTKTEIDKLIESEGRQPPDWFDSTPLEYPETLDLDWPEPAPAGWDNQKNVGQYVWDVVNPNPSRWRSGVKLMHHLMTLHQNDSAKRRRIMDALGGMYFRFFQDYPRAAFWWRQAGVQSGEAGATGLAECYWRMGNKQMASELLKTRTIRAEMIKLWGDMGDTRQALEMADAAAKSFSQQGVTSSQVHLYAGDACRLAGRYQDALRYYQKVVDEPAGLKGRVDQAKKRAAANIEAIRIFDRSDVTKVPDGTYRASSLGYEGDVTVEVVVRDKRIYEVRVVEHKEKQFYSALTDMPRQILLKQSVRGVDATSRATITAEAILNSTAKALADAAQP